MLSYEIEPVGLESECFIKPGMGGLDTVLISVYNLAAVKKIPGSSMVERSAVNR